MKRKVRWRNSVLVVAPAAVALLLGLSEACGTDADVSYQLPPAPIRAAVDRYNSNDVDPIDSILSPDRSTLLIRRRLPLVTIAEKSAPQFVRGDLTFYKETHRDSVSPLFQGLILVRIADGRKIHVRIPVGMGVGATVWSLDSRRVACLLYRDRRPGQPWVVEAATGAARALAAVEVSAFGPQPIQWIGNDRLLARLIPQDSGAPPAAATSPVGAIVSDSAAAIGGQMTGINTQNLFASEQERRLYDYYATVELTTITLNGKVVPFGLRGVVRPYVSPDGRFVLVTTVLKPYLAPDMDFLKFVPRRSDVYSAEGRFIRCVAERVALTTGTLADQGAGRTSSGRRQIHWRGDQPATLAWFEALDGGDSQVAAPWRDELRQWEAPFDRAPVSLLKSEYRFTEVRWESAQAAAIVDGWFEGKVTRRIRRFDPSQPEVAAVAEHWPGSRALWPQEPGVKERFSAYMDDAKTQVLTQRQSASESPNYHVRDLRSGELRTLTRFRRRPLIEPGAIRAEQISLRREDGLEFSAVFFVPSAWQPEDGPLPALFAGYPFEYRTAIDFRVQAEEGSAAVPDHEVTPLDGHSYREFVLLGYAVLSVRRLPVIGAADKAPQDTLVAQMVESATLVVNEAVRRGIADPKRIAVGGHSYGGMMAANLLAHSRLFCAGFASAGVHDFTQLPFGTQRETRTLWQAREVYVANSPFFNADKIEAPLLLIHSERDARVPVGLSRSLYHALMNLGRTTRLVILPFEGHSARARESVLHIQSEIACWLEKYVKGKGAASRG